MTTTAAVNPSPQALAIVFSVVVRERLSFEELHAVRAKNRTPAYSNCCATHDYCDANMLMLEAYSRCTGIPENDIELGDNINVFNKAWDIAKAREFRLTDAAVFFNGAR